MFALSGISATGYRSFSQPLEIALKPLTLLYGRNNAGKSAILRLLPILADSVADGAASPFDIGHVEGSGTSFRDVSQSSELKRISLALSWSGPGGAAHRDVFHLKYIDEADAVVVDKLELFGPGDQLQLKAIAEPFPDQDTYKVVQSDVGEVTIKPGLAGLVPAENSAIAAIDALRERVLGLRRNIQWLRSVRARWERLVIKTGSRYRMLESDGSHAAEILLTDKHVFQEVARWFAGPDIDRRLNIPEVLDRQHRILLNPQADTLRVDLLDTGEGMIQVLPVLVASALARARGTGHILAIEEPESHLHGNAQQALAAHLCEIAAGDEPPMIVAETRPEALTLGFLELLALASDGRHTILTKPPFGGGHDETIDLWCARQPESISEEVRAILTQGIRMATSAPSGAVRITITDAANEDWPRSRLSLEDVRRLLRTPLGLLLENGRNDLKFLFMLAPPTQRQQLRNAIDAGWIDVLNGGGLGEIEVLVKQLSDPPLATVANKARLLRLWVMFDRDSDADDRTLPSRASQRVKNLCEQVSQHAGCPWPLAHYQLGRRTIENYLPVQSLRLLEKRASGAARTNRRKSIDALCDLRKKNPAAARQLNMKRGLIGDIAPTARDEVRNKSRNIHDDELDPLFQGLDHSIRKALTHGFGGDIANLFAEHCPGIEEAFRKEFDRDRVGNDPSREAVLDTLFARL